MSENITILLYIDNFQLFFHLQRRRRISPVIRIDKMDMRITVIEQQTGDERTRSDMDSENERPFLIPFLQERIQLFTLLH